MILSHYGFYLHFPEVTRREGRGDNEAKKGKGHQGTCINDPWVKTMRGEIECRRWGPVEQGRVIGGNGDNCN